MVSAELVVAHTRIGRATSTSGLLVWLQPMWVSTNSTMDLAEEMLLFGVQKKKKRDEEKQVQHDAESESERSKDAFEGK